ncbi:MAG: DMT family transporter [Candidatus Levybacteria bacterium]|nr:DMT family transporter [Candidatus Levybacteria bacterium]
MSWQVLIAVSLLCYSVTTLLQRVFLKDSKINPVLFAIYFQFFTGVFIGIFGFALSDMSLPPLRPFLGNLLLMAVLYALANTLIFNALKQIEASRFAIIFSSRTLFTIFASSLLLKEGLTLQQFGGAFLILTGIVVANMKTKMFIFGKTEFLVLVAAACFGFALTNDSFLLKSFSLYPYAFINLIFPAIFLFLLNISKIKDGSFFFKAKFFGRMIVISFLYAVSVLTFFSALQTSGNSSQISAISTVSVIITVILAIIFLKEQENMGKKILGAILSFIGLLLITR